MPHATRLHKLFYDWMKIYPLRQIIFKFDVLQQDNILQEQMPLIMELWEINKGLEMAINMPR